MFSLSQVVAPETGLRRDAAFATTNFAGADGPPALVFAATPGFLETALAAPATAAVLTVPELADRVPAPVGLAVAAAPDLAFVKAHNRLVALGLGVRRAHAIDPGAEIHPTAIVEEGVRIGPGAVVEAGAIVLAGSEIGPGASVGAGAVVGAAGRFHRAEGGRLVFAHHAGGVRIGEQARIGPGSVVERHLFALDTEIGPRTTLGVAVSIAHGVRIGGGANISGGTMIGGFARLGDRVSLGPGAVVAHLIEMGDDARLEIGGVLVRSVPAGARYSGFFARSHARMRAMSLALARLAGREGG